MTDENFDIDRFTAIESIKDQIILLDSAYLSLISFNFEYLLIINSLNANVATPPGVATFIINQSLSHFLQWKNIKFFYIY